MKRMKKFLTGAAAAVMVASISATTIPASALLRGDVNNDGRISVSDFTCLKSWLGGHREPSVTVTSADVDNNGVINTWDIIEMNSILRKNMLFVQNKKSIFTAGQTFLDDGKFYGVMQEDGNVVVYNRDTKKAVFNTGTNLGSNAHNYRLMFQDDGNIVLYATPNYDGAKEQWIWKSNTSRSDRTLAYTLSFSESGQLEWYDSKGLVWSSANSKGKPNELYYPSLDVKMKSGYRYPDMRSAATDFVKEYTVISKQNNAEYGAAIDRVVENGKTKYVVCEIAKGWRNGHNGGVDILMWGETMAYVHVHGPATCSDNYYFSSKDIDLTLHNTAGHNINAYLGAPDGRLWECVPYGSPTVIATGIPH